MKFRSGFENLKIQYEGREIAFVDGFYSTGDEGEIAMLKNHPHVWSSSISEELDANTRRGSKKATAGE